MDETLLGTVPNRRMSVAERRAHTNLAYAEKRLIWVLIWKPQDTHLIERCEESCARLTDAWKKVAA